MITKEELKKEVDKIPDNLLDQVYTLLKRVLADVTPLKTSSKEGLEKWRNNLDQFTSDYMMDRNQPSVQNRESFD